MDQLHPVSSEASPPQKAFSASSIACATFGLLLAASGYAFHPLGMLAGIGMPITLVGFILACIFQARLMRVPKASTTQGTALDKVMFALLTFLTLICAIGILVASVYAVFTEAQAMLAAYRGQPKNSEATLTSCLAIGFVAAMAIGGITLYARKEFSWHPLLAAIYWASLVPVSILALYIFGRGSAYTN